MCVDWNHELREQIDFAWNYQFLPRMAGLTDEEYFREPVDGCWTAYRDGDGAWRVSWATPEPDPPPFTAFAWRLVHIAIPVLGVRASNHFGDSTLSLLLRHGWYITEASQCRPGRFSERLHMAHQADIRIELDGPSWLRLSYDFAAISPEALLRWFQEPERLAQWWGQEASVDAGIGGQWQVRWPAMQWTLDGQIVDLNDTRLVVSWAWEHEPDLPPRSLIIRAEPIEGGSRLHLIHGPYRQSEAFPREDDDRTSHRGGWEHFLPQLARAIAAEAPAVMR